MSVPVDHHCLTGEFHPPPRATRVTEKDPDGERPRSLIPWSGPLTGPMRHSCSNKDNTMTSPMQGCVPGHRFGADPRLRLGWFAVSGGLQAVVRARLRWAARPGRRCSRGGCEGASCATAAHVADDSSAAIRSSTIM
jgi:hypothetical protein